MSKTQSRWILFSGRALAAVALMTTGGFLQAQTAQASGAASSQNISAQEPISHLLTAVDMKADDDDSGLYSSSLTSSGDTQTVQEVASNTVPTFHFLDAFQYGGGHQRYGRPKYHGGNTNADGSPKWDFYVGGGFGVPVGSEFNYASTGWGFGGGGGRMWNAHFGVNIEFNYDHFGMTNDTLNDQLSLYNKSIALYNLQNPGNQTPLLTALGGNNHVWSITLQPIYNLKTSEGLGAYVTGGGGFYHKVANFTVPTIGTYCDPFYGCYSFTANQTIDHYTSNAFGINVGFGATYKFSHFSNERLFAEVRYVHGFNSYRPGVTNDTWTAANDSNPNFFPANSQHTTYLPVKFGIRF